MNIPQTLPDWLDELQDAFDTAIRLFDSGTCPLLELTEIYRLAAVY